MPTQFQVIVETPCHFISIFMGTSSSLQHIDRLSICFTLQDVSESTLECLRPDMRLREVWNVQKEALHRE